MVPERCERFRESSSLRLDGMLSTFEAALLDAHLARCASCHAFAVDLRAQTELLRSAELEPAPVLVDVVPAQRANLRRLAGRLVGAAAVAAVAALLTLTPTAGNRSSGSSSAARHRPLFAVFPAKPNAEATFEVPRLRSVSPESADGAVRGYYGIPA